MVNTIQLPTARLTVNQDWISSLRSDENKTLREIYLKHRTAMLAHIRRRYSLQEEDAKEIFQLSMIVFYDNVMTGKLNHLTVSLKSYLLGIAHNKVYELCRSQQKESKSKKAYSGMIQDILGEGNLHNDYVTSRMHMIARAIKRIGDPCQTILHMFYYKRASLRDITAFYNYKNENTTKSLKYKCIQRIKKYINHEAD